jgi:hypothetical protein
MSLETDECRQNETDSTARSAGTIFPPLRSLTWRRHQVSKAASTVARLLGCGDVHSAVEFLVIERDSVVNVLSVPARRINGETSEIVNCHVVRQASATNYKRSKKTARAAVAAKIKTLIIESFMVSPNYLHLPPKFDLSQFHAKRVVRSRQLPAFVCHASRYGWRRPPRHHLKPLPLAASCCGS